MNLFGILFRPLPFATASRFSIGKIASQHCKLVSTAKDFPISRKFSTSVDEKGLSEGMGQSLERKIGLTKTEQHSLMRKKPRQPADPHILKVAIIGSPNAGKSTLANRLLGWKIAPVSEKVHTTRKKTLGILTEKNSQIIFLDTPGMIQRATMKKHSLESSLLLDPHSSLLEADLVLTLVDVSTSWGRQKLDMEVLKVLHFHPNKKSILVLNKVDLVKPKKKLLQTTRLLTNGIVGGSKNSFLRKELEPDIDVGNLFRKMGGLKAGTSVDGSVDGSALSSSSNIDSNVDFQQVNKDTWQEYHKRLRKLEHQLVDANVKGWSRFEQVFMISAKEGSGVREVKDHLLNQVKPGPWEFPAELITPQPAMELARQCVWEQCMNHLPKEIPYKIHIEVALWDFDDEGMLHTAFNIVCSQSRQSGSVIGKDGETIRKIVSDAKQTLLDTFRCEMSFKLYVKVRPGGSFN